MVYCNFREIDSHKDVIIKGSAIVQEFYSQDFSQFEASWILKVTWTEMSLFADKSQVRYLYKLYIMWIVIVSKSMETLQKYFFYLFTENNHTVLTYHGCQEHFRCV